MKIRSLIVVVLAVILIGGVSMSYALWDKLTVAQEETINIGKGTEIQLEVVLEAPEGKKLVPNGVVMGPDDVDEVVLTYNVKLSRESADDLTLSVAASNVKINNDGAYADLINIDIQYETAINSDDVLVTVKVTLEEPSTQAAYDAIFDQAITFTLTFAAAQ